MPDYFPLKRPRSGGRRVSSGDDKPSRV